MQTGRQPLQASREQVRKEGGVKKLYNLLKNHAKAIIAVNKVLTGAIYIFYPVLIVYLAVSCHGNLMNGFAPYVVVPGVSFVLVSIFRSVYDAPRPYEEAGAPEPIINKDSPGKSFPSRHIFSVFIIAVTAFMVQPVSGILVGAAGVVLAIVRVAGGVHYPRDVIAGAVMGIALGILGYAIY